MGIRIIVFPSFFDVGMGYISYDTLEIPLIMSYYFVDCIYNPRENL